MKTGRRPVDRAAAATALGKSSSNAAKVQLFRSLKDGVTSVQKAAADALGSIRDKEGKHLAASAWDVSGAVGSRKEAGAEGARRRKAAAKVSALKKCLGPAQEMVDWLVCPLSGEFLREPRVDEHGRVFERDWIVRVPDVLVTFDDFQTKALAEALANACPETKLKEPAGQVPLEIPKVSATIKDAPSPPNPPVEISDEPLRSLLSESFANRRNVEELVEAVQEALRESVTYETFQEPVTSLVSGRAYNQATVTELAERSGQRGSRRPAGAMVDQDFIIDPVTRSKFDPNAEAPPNRALRGVLWALGKSLKSRRH